MKEYVIKVINRETREYSWFKGGFGWVDVTDDISQAWRFDSKWEVECAIDKLNAIDTYYEYKVTEYSDEKVRNHDDDKSIESSGDAVNHPKHYQDPSGIECIDIVRHRNFDIGNAIKYLWRAGLKQDADKTPIEKQIEDLRKAIWYIQDEITTLESKKSKECS